MSGYLVAEAIRIKGSITIPMRQTKRLQSPCKDSHRRPSDRYAITILMEDYKHSTYLRASKRQLDYLAVLYSSVGEINKSLYIKFSLPMARKEIGRLKRKQDRQRTRDRQLALF